ncbi:hypothetical protein H310_06887 [Aphanomyces invadans]|uniref:Uncharacterized protein n=1 Tax=Aphanomyces invadans TaxID=157072 RepID=A0A024U4J5_9STRA|nr:hypothetical protein H310_06887 [Aphanomyces invadans]ETW01326.1 hypothetical protein H310_06887 [Aphanomyces invadans]|eukprot:XP_008870324.1 hypothetical protein H310_06887 [Aphanomyces invadans]
MSRTSFDDAVATMAYDEIVQSMRRHWDDRHVIVEGLMALQQCIDRKGGDDDAKKLGVAGACEVVLDAMASTMQSEEVQLYGSQAFRFLARAPRNILRLETKRGLDQLMQTLIHYMAVPRVVREVLWALATLVAASQPSGLRFLETLDGAQLVLKTLQRHQGNLDIQHHGCQCVLSIAIRFRSRFREDAVVGLGSHMIGLLVRGNVPQSLVVICLKFITAVTDKESAAHLFADAAWFRCVFIAHVDDDVVVDEVVFLYMSLCHVSPAHAVELSAGGGLECVHEAIVTYHGQRKECTVYQLLRLVHHVLALSATHDALVPTVLECQSSFMAHAKIQIEICCIVRLALPSAPTHLWTTQLNMLDTVARCHPTDSILQRECKYARAALLLAIQTDGGHRFD